MGMLDRINRGVQVKPDLILIYGTDGVGKTTFAAQAPKPIFLGVENGSDAFDVARFPKLSSISEAITAVRELIDQAHEFKTLVIDSVDWLETLLHKEICKKYSVTNIAEAAKGYGKGYLEALAWWDDFRVLLDELREKKKMNIILIGHAEVGQFNDPKEQTTYDRYRIKLNEKASSLLREWVDCIFFATFEIFTKKDENKKVRAYGEGARIMYTERRPGFDAKNRKSLPFDLPLGWEDYENACKTSVPNTDNLVNQIKEMLKEVKDEELAKTVAQHTEKHKASPTNLEAIINRLRVRLEGQEQEKE